MRLGERQLQKKNCLFTSLRGRRRRGGEVGREKSAIPLFFPFLTIPYPFRRLLRGLGAFAKELILKCSYVKLNLGELVFKERGNTPGGTTYIMALIAYTGSLPPKGVPFSPFSG